MKISTTIRYYKIMNNRNLVFIYKFETQAIKSHWKLLRTIIEWNDIKNSIFQS